MKAKVIYPTDSKVHKERENFSAIKSDMMELEMSETSLCHYKMLFRQVGNGMNVWIEEDCKNGDVVSHSKNFECLVRKIILAEKIYDRIKMNALCGIPMFSPNQTEEDKEVSKSLECAFRTIDNYIEGYYQDLKDIDMELICKAAVYKKIPKKESESK
jgi:hypothetical protein